MKKFKFLLVVLAALLILPFSVFADEDSKDDSTKDAEVQEVKLYFFHGDGCGFCSKAAAWFEEIEDEYGDKFEVVAYEVWNNPENAELMEEVAKVRKETANGVPYIIIGNQSWNGFDDDYKEAILSKIDSEYKQDSEERYDIMNYVGLDSEDEDTTTRDILILLVLVGVVAAVSVGVVVARKTTN